MKWLEKMQQPKGPLNGEFIWLTGAVVGLCVTGAMMVTSASSVVSVRENGSAWALAQRQVFAMLIGAFLMWQVSKLKVKFIKAMSYPVLLISLAGLCLTLVMGVEIGGQRNWIWTPFGNWQPSEYAKLALVMVSALWISTQLRRKASFGLIIAGPAFFSLVIIGLVLAERDLGTPIILGGIAIGILFASGISWRWMASLTAVAVIGITGVSLVGPAYRLNRFKAWFSPQSFPDTYGYQLLHGQYALAKGGIFGEGLGQSSEKWGALPAAHTDFILSVIGEELGVIGTLGILLLLSILVLSGVHIASRTEDDFSRMLAFGVVTWIAVQVIINVGAIVRAMPITGVPLPFVSYGGSSLIPAMTAVGILLAIARDNAQKSRKVRVAEEEEEV